MWNLGLFDPSMGLAIFDLAWDFSEIIALDSELALDSTYCSICEALIVLTSIIFEIWL